jgi:hypothetical protein
MLMVNLFELIAKFLELTHMVNPSAHYGNPGLKGVAQIANDKD